MNRGLLFALIAAAIMCLTVVPVTGEESDAEYGVIYKTRLIDELNDTAYMFRNDAEGYMNSYATRDVELGYLPGDWKDISKPTHDGYTFKGWYDYTHDKWLPENQPILITYNATYYAVWEEKTGISIDEGTMVMIMAIVVAGAFCGMVWFYVLSTKKD